MMLALTSCRFVKRRPIVSGVSIERQRKRTHKSTVINRCLTALSSNGLILIVFSILIDICVPCVNAVPEPCNCNGRFYRFCPDECKNQGLDTEFPNDLVEDDLFSAHPDHFEAPSGTSRGGVVMTPQSKKDMEETVREENGEVVVHRKVYVKEDESPKYPLIHPFKIVIPVHFDQPKSTVIQAPEPIFKMKKYETFETKPETVHVPVVTTIIKPKNVKKSQIIL